MDEARNRFKAALIEDLRHIYEKGLDPAASATSMPALAELAESLCTTPDDGKSDYYSQAIEAVLHDSIGRIEGKDHRTRKFRRRAEERRAGFEELFGISEYPSDDLTGRQNNAAGALGYSSGDSLRQSKPERRKAPDLLIEELVGHLLTLADEHHFIYSVTRTWGTFYPDRPVYDYTRLHRDYGRYGPMAGGPMFNSFINTPSYGDERAFFDGRRGNQSDTEHWDPVASVTSDETAVLRIYVDNMAYVHPDDPYSSTAYGARVRIHLPTATATVLRARGYIWADNADMVEDTVDLIGYEPFRVVYVPGSAVLMRHDIYVYGLDDSIVEDDGALIGHSVMDGILPAGNLFEYTALVKITVRIVTS